jgi:hypothetical protein
METIEWVTDPRTGLASKLKWLPTVAEIREACEDHYGPKRRLMEWDAKAKLQIAERDKPKLLSGPRPTYEDLVKQCHEVGLMIGPKSARVKPVDVPAFLNEHGVTREQWDAIPDRKRTA